MTVRDVVESIATACGQEVPLVRRMGFRVGHARPKRRHRGAGHGAVRVILRCALAFFLLPDVAIAEPLSPAMEHAQEVISAKVSATNATRTLGQVPPIHDIWRVGVLRTTSMGQRDAARLALDGVPAHRRDVVAGCCRSSWIAIRPYATDRRFHDIGFMFLGSDWHDWRLTGDTEARQRVVTAARSLAARYDSDVGMVRTLDKAPGFWVYNDTMMNIDAPVPGCDPQRGAKCSRRLPRLTRCVPSRTSCARMARATTMSSTMSGRARFWTRGRARGMSTESTVVTRTRLDHLWTCDGLS